VGTQISAACICSITHFTLERLFTIMNIHVLFKLVSVVESFEWDTYCAKIWLVFFRHMRGFIVAFILALCKNLTTMLTRDYVVRPVHMPKKSEKISHLFEKICHLGLGLGLSDTGKVNHALAAIFIS